MPDDLVFGWRTAILTAPMLTMLLIAAALTQPLQNRIANRLLASLLIVLTGMCTPWAIGFAGFYDLFPWLSFAPFSISLAVAPLLYLYLYALLSARLPGSVLAHLALPLIQFIYLSICFMLPLELKWAWSDISADIYGAVNALLFVSQGVFYGVWGKRLVARYRDWLSERRSDVDRFALRWVNRALIVAGIMLTVWLIFEIRDRIDPLGYSGLMGLYIALSTFGVFLGIEGWRHASLAFPHFDPESGKSAAVDDDADTPAEPPASEAKDWESQAREWAQRIAEERLYRDPELSIGQLARRLGTNQTYISRALNEGLGQNFASYINNLRSEDVAQRLKNGESAKDILSIALDSGFNSKASFHRAFRARYGMTPSAYRESQSQKR